MKTLLLAFIFISVNAKSAKAMQSFSGNWHGQGKAVVLTANKVRNCQDIALNIQQTDQKLIFTNSGYVCQDLKADFDNSVIEIRNDMLFEQGQYVGSIEQNAIRFNIRNNQENYIYELTLEKTGSILTYDEKWYEIKPQSEELVMTVYGVLKSK